jgi:hypothetical protein
MLTHVHKVIHLVVGTFELGWRSWWSGGVVFHCETVTGHWHWGDLHVRSVESSGAASVCGVTRHWVILWPDTQWPHLVMDDELWCKLCIQSTVIWRFRSTFRRSGNSLEPTWRAGCWGDRRIQSMVGGTRGSVDPTWRGASSGGSLRPVIT